MIITKQQQCLDMHFNVFFDCRNAGLERHIRTGKDTDVAYLAPTLIPVPGTFEGDKPSQQLSSYVGQSIIRKVRTSLVRTDIGTNSTLIQRYLFLKCEMSLNIILLCELCCIVLYCIRIYSTTAIATLCPKHAS